jgi:hypothetical protein
MVHKKVVGFGLAAAGFFIIALLVAGAVMGGDGGMADDRIADLSGSEGGCGDSLAASPVTSGFNYQGRLTDSSGNPLNGTYDITFRLYDAASGGTALAEVLHSVIVHNGLFATTITFDPTYFDGRALWLGIQVGYDPEMTPRQALRAVPYALSLRPGAVIEGSLFDEPILWARTPAENGEAIHAGVAGDGGTGVRVVALGEESRGVYTTTSGNNSPGILAVTTGNVSAGYFAQTSGYDSIGVFSQTFGDSSEGLFVLTTGNGSPAVYGYSIQDVGVYGTGKEAGGYFTTAEGGTGWPYLRAGVNVSTQYDYNPGVYVATDGIHSEGVHASTIGDGSNGVFAGTQGDNSDGVYVETFGNNSEGVYAYTQGDDSHGVYAYTQGDNSHGVHAYTYGYNSPAVYGYSSKDVGVYGKGKEGGYFTTTVGGTGWWPKAGVNVSTQYDRNPGVFITTTGDISDGVCARTFGDYSVGVDATTFGNNSRGVYAMTTSDWASVGVHASTSGNYSDALWAETSGVASWGVMAYSDKSIAIHADTNRTDHNYAFQTTDDNIYVGGKIDVIGTVDPIIVEGFNADPLAKYEMGDVVYLDESGTVKPCTKADDTRAVGVVGPTVELEDGEITVVIMGHQGAKPDEEHVQVLEEQLEEAEERKVEALQLKLTGKLEEAERLDSEIAMLRSQLEEAKSVTRQVVWVKADASYGSIKAGDLLTTSATLGHAMKAQPVELGGVEIYRPGTIIGKAMEPLSSGTGLIEIFVTLQ